MALLVEMRLCRPPALLVQRMNFAGPAITYVSSTTTRNCNGRIPNGSAPCETLTVQTDAGIRSGRPSADRRHTEKLWAK